MPDAALEKVLVVEDEDRLRELIVRRVGTMGHEAVGARTAEEGLRLMEAEARQIILLDLNLPVMGGMDFFQIVHKRWPKTAVIIMTGFGDLESAQAAIRMGVVDFLMKPCHLGDIEAALGRARRTLADPDQPPALRDLAPAEPAPDSEPVGTLAEIQKRAILRALERHDGNKSAVARELGITRRTLYNRLAEYGMDTEDEA